MLKITIERNAKTATLKLDGRLAGPWNDELDRTWMEVTTDTLGDCVILDLRNVTFVDIEGRKRLKSMCRQGAQFKTAGCFGKGMIEDIVRDCEEQSRLLRASGRESAQ